MTIKEFTQKVFSTAVWGNCLGVVVTAALLAGGTLFYLQYYTRHGEVLEMPNLHGQSADVATRKLRALGLRAEVADTGYVRNLPAGVILEQSIAAGTEIKPGRLVALTINSSGSPSIALPDLADNSSQREAQAKLTAIGFRIAPAEYIEGEKEWVYGIKVNGRTVSAGTRVPAGSAITLVVGNGKTEEEFNGNDSLDYMMFGAEDDMPLTDESTGYEEDIPATVPLDKTPD